VRQSRYCSNF